MSNTHIIDAVVLGTGVELLFKFANQPFLRRKAAKSERAMVGNMLVALGIILTAMYVFFIVSYIFSPQTSKVDLEFILGLSTFVIVGIPVLVAGIFLINNP
jgi:hypothetical protein